MFGIIMTISQGQLAHPIEVGSITILHQRLVLKSTFLVPNLFSIKVINYYQVRCNGGNNAYSPAM
jgi:hypothetical protein